MGKGDDIINEHRTLDAHRGGVASLGATGNVITLWSPDHTYANVQVSDLVAGASDNCDAGVN